MISHKVKQELITGLQFFIGLGVIIILVMLVLLAGKIKTNQAQNHSDTQDATNTIICMLQVPVAQRTPDLANQCRKQVQQADDAANGTTSTSTSATTTATPATATAPASSTTTTTSPTPNQTPTTTEPTTTQTPSTGAQASLPLNCKIDILGIHLGC